MQLKDREVSAITSKVNDGILKIQNEQYVQMCEEYKNSPQFNMLLTGLIDFIERVKKAAERMPKELRSDAIRFGDFYIRLDEHSDADCEDLLMHAFRKKHNMIHIPFSDIQREVILASVDDKSVDSMINRLMEYFGKQKLIE